MFKTFFVGILLGLAAAAGALYALPIVDQHREVSYVAVAPNGGNIESFHINIPVALSDEITANPSRAREIGIEWSSMQAKELLAHNVCGLHYYIMANPSPSVKVIESLGL